MTKTTFLSHINKNISKICAGYHEAIPLDEIFAAVKEEGGLVVDEAGEPWSGILCGAEGHCVLHVNTEFRNAVGLYIGWYKMEHTGRYEVTSYVS